MKYFTFALAAVAFAASENRRVSHDAPCYRKSETPVVSANTIPLAPVDDLPEQWTWNSVDGTNYLTNVRN